MSEPVLELSEHELYFLPPGTPAIAPATRVEIEVDGELRIFLARYDWIFSEAEGRGCSSVFYRREEAEETDIFGGMSWILNPKYEVLDHAKVDKMRETINLKCSNRFWRAPDADYGIVFYPDGFASIYWGWGNHLGEAIRFKSDQARLENTLSRKAFWESCQRLHTDENTILHYALRWKKLSVEQRDDIAFRCENGDWPTLRRLFSRVLIVLAHQYQISPAPRSGRIPWRFDKALTYHRLFEKHGATASAKRWQTAICDIMRPAFWSDEPIFVIEWRHESSHDSSLYTVRCGIPTHHEALEAQLELRDFLRPHLPAAEIEALFAPE